MKKREIQFPIKQLASRTKAELALISAALSPVLLCSAAATGDLEDMQILLEREAMVRATSNRVQMVVVSQTRCCC